MAGEFDTELLLDIPASSSNGEQVREVLAALAREWKKIVLFSLLIAALTLLANLFVFPPYYRADASLLPETDKSKMGALGQFAGIASLAGLNVAGGDVSKLYPTIITSDAILMTILDRPFKTNKYPQPVTLVQFFEVNEGSEPENREKALKNLRDLLTVSLDNKTGVVSLTLDMKEPQLAADVLNSIIDELDLFMRRKKVTSASEQAKWISDRLSQVENQLHSTENRLKDFREKNRRVADSPDLALEQERLIREVNVASTIYIELKKQYELAKIEEIKNLSIVNVLDPGRPPVKKERPKRAVNTAAAFFLAFVAFSTYYGMKPVYKGKLQHFAGALSPGRRTPAGE